MGNGPGPVGNRWVDRPPPQPPAVPAIRPRPASDQKVYEYACHEGNYSLGNIMRGARLPVQEALAAKPSATH